MALSISLNLDRQIINNKEGMTYRGINCAKNASWGKGKSIYSIIFTTASDLINDLKFTISVINVTRIN